MTKQRRKKHIRLAGNIAFVGLLLFLTFHTGAKAWVLKQFVALGLFNAEIKKEAASQNIIRDGLSFSFSDGSGNIGSIAGLKGKVVLINFWATWCPPCIAEMPSLYTLYQELQHDKRFVFLFISEDDDFSKAAIFLKNKNYRLPLAKRQGPVSPIIFSGTLPTTIVLDKEGNIVLKKEGLGGYDAPEFIQQLKSLAQ